MAAAKSKKTSISASSLYKEKPKKSKSNLAITGLYFFDKKVVSFAKKLKLSKRKELEIVDLLNKYLKINRFLSPITKRYSKQRERI